MCEKSNVLKNFYHKMPFTYTLFVTCRANKYLLQYTNIQYTIYKKYVTCSKVGYSSIQAVLEIQKVVAEEPLNEYGGSVQRFLSIFILPLC